MRPRGVPKPCPALPCPALPCRDAVKKERTARLPKAFTCFERRNRKKEGQTRPRGYPKLLA